MKVFISWSGDRSMKVAELLDEWIQCVIQAVVPFVSTRHIDGGSVWFNTINEHLASTTIGIICLTAENKDKPWILFEAGALAKGLTTTRIGIILVDLNESEVDDPLRQFNLTTPTKESMFKLMKVINNLTPIPLKDAILKKVFETYWPKFETDFKLALKASKDSPAPMKKEEGEILNEILSSVKSFDKRLYKLEIPTVEAITSEDIRRELREQAIIMFAKERIRIGDNPEIIIVKTSSQYNISVNQAREFVRKA